MNQDLIVERCAVCNVKSSLRCAQCQNKYYCNREHQRQDWKRHKSDCKKILNDTERNCVTSSENINANPTVPEETVAKFRHVENSEKGTILHNNEIAESTSKIRIRKEQKSSVFIHKDAKDSDKIVNNTVKYVQDSVNKYNIINTAKEYSGSDAITYEGSSENEILSTSTQQLSSSNYTDTISSNVSDLKTINRPEDSKMPVMSDISEHSRAHKDYPEVMFRGNMAPFCHNKNTFVMDSTDPHYEICQSVIRDMTAYGVCVLDNFLGKERGMLVLKEVLDMYSSGIFQAGQLVSNPGRQAETQTIRSDRIAWIDGKEPHCHHIGQLIQQVDSIILRANKLSNNGKMGDYIINGRTKAMVACYPGSGSHYVKHVDNPNKDGRCITAIYYLNLDWDVKTCGGLLRVFPEGYQHQVADIAPIFDRILFFWSDRRNPHEVQPAYNTRYAITLWYFDAIEREEATRRYREKHAEGGATSTNK